jgi:endonuclease/exonuclease/phosphatase (EEP) superfamily protein YafD
MGQKKFTTAQSNLCTVALVWHSIVNFYFNFKFYKLCHNKNTSWQNNHYIYKYITLQMWQEITTASGQLLWSQNVNVQVQCYTNIHTQIDTHICIYRYISKVPGLHSATHHKNIHCQPFGTEQNSTVLYSTIEYTTARYKSIWHR